MLERRSRRRQRVCLQGVVAAGLVTPIRNVRIRNITEDGAEIVVAKGHIESKQVDFCSSRCEGVPRPARIVWRRLNKYGLQFLEPYATDEDDEDVDATDSVASAAPWNRHSLHGGFG